MDEKTIERFWKKVKIAGPDDCWEWQGFKMDGYGGFTLKRGQNVLAHRMMFFLTHGYWPDQTLHSCDNPPCVNPAHLSSGTRSDNIQDAFRKGRNKGNTKLTKAQVSEMRRLRQDTGATYKEIGRLFGVTKNAARNAIVGKTWNYS